MIFDAFRARTAAAVAMAQPGSPPYDAAGGMSKPVGDGAELRAGKVDAVMSGDLRRVRLPVRSVPVLADTGAPSPARRRR